MTQTTVGEALVLGLKDRGVACVFGIPGVHTVELYRGLAASGIRHVTPRHEQGAGFMADGYARVSGKPGVAFVITGPGLTNALTPMAQARAESVPVLVISGANTSASLGKGLGHLHELPDQHALARTVAKTSCHVAAPEDLDSALEDAFAALSSGRPSPAHIQVPLDVAGEARAAPARPVAAAKAPVSNALLKQAANMLKTAGRVVILAGGGTKHAARNLRVLAERLDAPVVQTTNARGVLHDHPLSVPASPSLKAVRSLIEDADCVLALGTELGQTDFDMYATGTMPHMPALIRVDVCQDQLSRHPAELRIEGRVEDALTTLLDLLPTGDRNTDGAARATEARDGAWLEIGADYRQQVLMLNAIRDAAPSALIVGDSTQPIYAGNLYYDHDRPGGWFNAATGYGALGYGIPAAIGASIAAPSARVICLVGDGGAQFSLPEVMAAVDENLPVTFVIWNNHGYREIATAMEDVGVTVVGCDPTPPDFAATALSFTIPHRQVPMTPYALAMALHDTAGLTGPQMIEIKAPPFVPAKD